MPRLRLSFPLVLVLALCACGDKDDTGHDDGHDHDHGEDGGTAGGDASSGEAIYGSTCAACHGASGEGGTGPAMADVMRSHSETAVVDVVLNGSGGMPAVLSDADDAADVAAYCADTWGE